MFPTQWTVYASDSDDVSDLKEIHRVEEQDSITFDGPWTSRIFILPNSKNLQSLNEFHYIRFVFTKNGGSD